MTSIDKASWGETKQFLQNLGTGGLTLESLRGVNQQPDLARAMVAALSPAQPSIDWSPLIGSPDSYFERLVRWNQLRGWDIGNTRLDELAAELQNTLWGHSDLYPLSLDLWLGRDLAYNWTEVMWCLGEGVRALGYDWEEGFDVSQLSFYDSGTSPRRHKTARPTGLDLSRYWDRKNGLVPIEVQGQQTSWPGLSVAWLLALNPQVAVVMDGETVPYLFAPGLVVDSHCSPVFGGDVHEVEVCAIHKALRWYSTSVVSFRE